MNKNKKKLKNNKNPKFSFFQMGNICCVKCQDTQDEQYEFQHIDFRLQKINRLQPTVKENQKDDTLAHWQWNRLYLQNDEKPIHGSRLSVAPPERPTRKRKCFLEPVDNVNQIVLGDYVYT